MVVVIVRVIDAVKLLDDALLFQPPHFFDHSRVAAIHQESCARAGDDEARVGDRNDPLRQFFSNRFGCGHPVDRYRTEYALSHGAYLVVAPIPPQRVDGEMAGERCLQPAGERVDRLARIVDNRTARWDQDIRLPLRDLAQALNDVARAGSPAVVTIFLDLRNRVLETEQVEDSTVSIDQVAN